jgi:CHAT domain-containing protein/tetratricopeptide (TPR) repeat protein
MKRISLSIFIILLCFDHFIYGQKQDCYKLIIEASQYYNAGDFIKAKETLLKVLDPANKPDSYYIYTASNNLGVVMQTLGEYDKALAYNLKAESYIKNLNSIDLADIFNNRGNIFNIKKSYDVAREYLEKSIRIYQNSGLKNDYVIERLNAAYINISVGCIETGQYKEAISYLEKSIELASLHNFSNLSLSYLNMAKAYNKIGNSEKAGFYFLKSIAQFKKDFGEGYYRMTDAYFDYGLFLQSAGRYSEALEVFNKALKINLKNYGDKHTLVSLSYKHIGDIYSIQSGYDSALYYYQKSLIAVVKNFDNQDIFSNPPGDSSIFDIRLLDNLKSKARTLYLISEKETEGVKKMKFLGKSLETNDLAIDLIDRIRSNFLSEESRIYLAENEKETYLFGVSVAFRLFSINHDKGAGIKMYSIAQKAKAAILRNEITGNELLYSAGVPDSLRSEQNSLTGEIAAYSNLIVNENRASHPDSLKIVRWKDDLFKMNRKREEVTAGIEKAFPQFHVLIRKTEPVALPLIQKMLKRNEVIIDYLLSNNYIEGKRKLYMFCISRNSLDSREELLDSSFVRNAEIILNTDGRSLDENKYTAYTGALNFMYTRLIHPIEGLLTGNRLIIIPDEEIGWLPFDAFIKIKPEAGSYDFENLHYLINDFTFSYGYSSSLIFNSQGKMKDAKVFAFSPDYSNATTISSLKGANLEIESIFQGFSGQNFSGSDATKENFIQSLRDTAIFHLAMHSMSDSLNSRYSYLMFDTHNSSADKGKLFNYEISLQRINSPMVVLSSCNSGTGTLYYGEGMMSLSRGFILAGASSVVKTAWDVNDDASSIIMTHFYDFLSLGKKKNYAMHLAKLKYLKNSSPAFKAPYFWAAYEVLGDFSPVTHSRRKILIAAILAMTAVAVIIYFRRLRIFSERSR